MFRGKQGPIAFFHGPAVRAPADPVRLGYDLQPLLKGNHTRLSRQLGQPCQLKTDVRVILRQGTHLVDPWVSTVQDGAGHVLLPLEERRRDKAVRRIRSSRSSSTRGQR